ncbi:MAG: helix-turn-helix transcriptional regulator [Clostridia bacterium]|nr:AraC family transcriptional regulator [Oscillospiraceae bacterium]MBQ7959635.1 helix-turn-helix transcriptional regulator [Clostridia bacterium]
MEYKLKTFNIQLTVSRIANIHYFEFVRKYHTIEDYHDFCELLYVDNGSVMVKGENYSGLVTNNQLIIHRPNEVHSLMCAEDVAPNVIIIGFECLCDAIAPFSKAPVTLSSDHKKMLAEIMKEGMNTYEPPYNAVVTDMKKRKNPVFGADQMLKIKMEAFLITLIRDFNSIDASLGRADEEDGKLAIVQQYLTEHYMEKIQLDNLCFLFETNKTTLCRNFRNAYGKTITEYIGMLKEREAKRLLRENELSITEISDRLGFNSIHYFCRFFKKATGQSPKEYLKSIRSKLNI